MYLHKSLKLSCQAEFTSRPFDSFLNEKKTTKMVRKKVKLEFIENDAARRVTYKKRFKGILKKTEELSILCGVDACAVIYGPYDQAPEVWPSSEPEARRILEDFKRKPEVDQSQRKFDQQTFLNQCAVKAQEKLLRMQTRNREMEMENIMSDLLSGKPVEQVAPSDLGDLVWVIDDKLRSIQLRMRMLEGAGSAPNPHPYASTSHIVGGNGNPSPIGGDVPSEMQAGPSRTSGNE